MKTLSVNDIWILRTLAKLNDFVRAKHENFYDEFIALRTHINQMTYRNRETTLRDVYFLLRTVATEYKKGNEAFMQYYKEQKVSKAIYTLVRSYRDELAEVSTPTEANTK